MPLPTFANTKTKGPVALSLVTLVLVTLVLAGCDANGRPFLFARMGETTEAPVHKPLTLGVNEIDLRVAQAVRRTDIPEGVEPQNTRVETSPEAAVLKMLDEMLAADGGPFRAEVTVLQADLFRLQQPENRPFKGWTSYSPGYDYRLVMEVKLEIFEPAGYPVAATTAIVSDKVPAGGDYNVVLADNLAALNHRLTQGAQAYLSDFLVPAPRKEPTVNSVKSVN